MGDVLSQNEIDNLLAAISSGELDADAINDEGDKKVKDYNFAKPSKLSKEHLKTLEIIFEHYGRLLSTHLPIYLQKNLQVEVTSAEAVSYSEFSNALSNPILLGILNMEPLNGKALMSVSANFGYAMVDRMLGGQGKALETKRNFSEIELIILEKVFHICIEMLKEPWEHVVDLEPSLETIETDAQFLQIYSPNEMSAVIMLRIVMSDVEGRMSVCLPYSLLESVIDKLNTRYWYSAVQSEDGNDYTDLIELSLSKATVPVKVVLGRSVISVNEFINLQRGDIIKISTKTDDELDVFVGNMLKFTAIPGTSQDLYAVRIKTIVRKEQEDE